MEGVPDEIIIQAVERSGAMDETPREKGGITKADLYDLGLSGGQGSAEKRKALLKALQLPENLSSNALLDVLNCMTDREELTKLVNEL